MKLYSAPLIRHSLTRSVIGYVVLFSLVPLIGLGAVSYGISRSAVHEKVQSYTTEIMTEKKNYLNLLMNDVESLLISLSSQEDIRNVLQDTSYSKKLNNDYERLSTQAKIGDILSGYINMAGIIAIDLLSVEANHYHVGETLLSGEINDSFKEQIFSEAANGSRSVIWMGIVDSIIVNSGHPKVIAAVKIIRQIDPQTMEERPIGFMIVSYDPIVFHQNFQRKGQAGQTFRVIDQRNRIISDPDINQIGKTLDSKLTADFDSQSGLFHTLLDGQNTLVMYDRSEDSKWTLLSFIQMAYIDTQILGIARNTLLTTVISAVLAVFFIIHFSRSVVAPIKEVTRRFKFIRSGMPESDLYLSTTSQDEIGELVLWFNTFLKGLAEKRRTEAELLENRKRLADIVDFLPDATLAIDNEKRVIIWNMAMEKITGVPASEMIGKGDRAYAIPFYGEVSPLLIDYIFMDNKEIAVRNPIITREGECFTTEVFCNALYDNKGAWVFAKASLLHDQSGNLVGAIESIRDITERKRAEADREKLQVQLNHAQKMESVGRLAGGVAHDFNNMLQAITGNAEMALGEIDHGHSLHGNISEILKVARRSADLTRQLLAFARKQTISPKVLNLNETISSMLKMLKRLIGEDIDFSWKPALNPWPLKIDPSQLDQILVNLCVNARDAINGVGSVTIETQNVLLDQSDCESYNGLIPGEYLLLAISDTGMGIEKGILDLIFEPFFTTKELGKGTGLGLSTVYGIVKQNDGFIFVTSEQEQGTTFRIYLPRTEDDQVKTATGAIKQRNTHGTETVLLVEDDESILEICKLVLERFKYKVLVAHNPNDALALAENYPDRIDLLITDVIMPEMNGQELRQRMHDIQRGLKVIFISGYTADVIDHHGVLDKEINFLQKPFAVQALVEKVRFVLDDNSI